MRVISRALKGMLFCFPLLTAVAGEGVPNTGALLQQIQSLPKVAPALNLPGTMIEGSDGSSTRLPSSAPIPISQIRITRNTLFDNATLMALVKHAEGKSLTLPELGELAGQITSYYQSNGYPISRAIIPAQTIAGGIVRIEVIEAKIGAVKLDNTSRVRDALLQSTLAALKSGQNVEQAAIDHILLLISDVAGVIVQATLKPGQFTGTSDLVVATMPLPALSGNIVTDNYGNSFTGKVRTTGTITHNNLLSQGDTVNFVGLTSGSGLNYWRLAYEAVVTGKGVRIGASASTLEYFLDGYNLNGSAQVQSLWSRRPLVRSEKRNVYAQIQYETLQTGDPNVAANRKDRSLDNWTVSLSGDARAALFANGVSSWSASLTNGHVSFYDSSAEAIDANTAQTSGRFSKLNLNLAHLQGMGVKNSLYLAYTGQWTNTNLDSSQKLSVGGPNSVRAYRAGVLSGDTGHVLSAEWRHELGLALGGQWQGLAFVDTARLTINKTLWPRVTGQNNATLSGAGLGLRWSGLNNWSGRALLAYPLGSASALASTTRSPQGWVEVRKGF